MSQTKSKSKAEVSVRSLILSFQIVGISKENFQMRKTNRWMTGVLAALLGAVVVSGCGGTAEETPAEGDGHIHKEGDKH
jgi:hypothetical protein